MYDSQRRARPSRVRVLSILPFCNGPHCRVSCLTIYTIRIVPYARDKPHVSVSKILSKRSVRRAHITLCREEVSVSRSTWTRTIVPSYVVPWNMKCHGKSGRRSRREHAWIGGCQCVRYCPFHCLDTRHLWRKTKMCRLLVYVVECVVFPLLHFQVQTGTVSPLVPLTTHLHIQAHA